jgi:hypothetical protein
MRNVARRDTVNGGPIGVRIRKKPRNTSYKLVSNLNDFYNESPLFTFIIPENSAYRTFMESPMEAATYQCVTAGIFVIISHWPTGTYRLSVLGTGVGSYLTRSIYDIVVTPQPPDLVDISQDVGPNLQGEPHPMDFVADWTSPKAAK